MVLNMPLISVGITSYDKPELLYLTIQNIVNQTYKRLEIIIALDSPPDPKTIKICKNFSKSDTRIKLFIHRKNIGSDANTRFVLSKATGELFFWADEDDLRDLNWVEELATPFNDHSITFSIGLVQNIDQQGLPLVGSSFVQFTGNNFISALRFFVQPERFGKCNLIYALFRTESLRKAKHWTFYKCNGFFFGDNIFAFDQILNGKGYYKKNVCFYKRVHNYSEADLKMLPTSVERAMNFIRYTIESLSIINVTKIRILFYFLLPIKLLVLLSDTILSRLAAKLR